MQLTKHWAGAAGRLRDRPGVVPGREQAWRRRRLPARSRSSRVADGAKSDRAPRPRRAAPTRSRGSRARLLLASGGQDGAVKLWDGAAGQHVATAPLGPLLGRAPRVAAVRGRAHPRGRGRQEIHLPQPRRLASAHAFKEAPKTITALAWEPRGACAAVAYFGGVCLWDADGGCSPEGIPLRQRDPSARVVARRPLARVGQPGPERPPLDAGRATWSCR